MPNQLAEPSLVAVFRGLADPTRLAVVERLSIAPASASELARPFGMALPSFMQHLQVLEHAGLVTSHKTGRTRVFQLRPHTLNFVSAWFGTVRNHWDRRLDQLEKVLQPTPPPKPTNTQKRKRRTRHA